MRNYLLITFLLNITVSFGIVAQDTEEESPFTRKDTRSDELKQIKKELESLKSEVLSLKKNKPKESTPDKTLPPKTESEYKSPMKGDLSGEYTKNMLILPEHARDIRHSSRGWVSDQLKIGFHFRPKFESSQNADFNKTTDDYKSFVSQNAQVWMVFDFSRYFTFKVTIQDSRLWGGSLAPKTGTDGRYGMTTGIGQDYSSTTTTLPIKTDTGLREAFLVFKDFQANSKVFVGRQILGFGDQRILGGRNDSQIGNSFDAVRYQFDSKYYTFNIFGAVNTEESNGPYGMVTANGKSKGTINDSYLSGIYNTFKFEELFLVDLYYFGLHKKYINKTVQVTSLDRDRQRDDKNTFGLRFSNRTKNNSLPENQIWDWTLEFSVQRGHTGETIDASWDILSQSYGGKKIYSDKVLYDSKFFVFQTGLTFFKEFRIGAQYAYASGDPNRGDARVATWDPLFASRQGGFPYFDSGNGIASNSYYYNVKSYSLHLNWTSKKYGRYIFVVYDVYKAKLQDGWYTTNGDLVTKGSTENYYNDRYGNTTYLGKKLLRSYDFIYQYYFGDMVSIWAGGSITYAGDSIRNIRNNLQDTDYTKRYTLDPVSKYFFLSVSAAL